MNSKAAQIRVAIVEDDVVTRKTFAATIAADPNFAVVAEFGEGKTAIASLPAVAPDVLLVDIGLPDISGIEVIRTAAACLQQCDILVVTTLGDQQTIMSALEAGADGYILKEGGSEELRSSIRALRSGGSPLSPLAARSILDRLKPKEVNQGPVDTATQLSQREIHILQTIARGHTYGETAKICGIAAGTVHSHLKHIYHKLSVNSKVQAINRARDRKIIT